MPGAGSGPCVATEPRRAPATEGNTLPSALDSTAPARYGHPVGFERIGMAHRPTAWVVRAVPGFRWRFQSPPAGTSGCTGAKMRRLMRFSIPMGAAWPDMGEP